MNYTKTFEIASTDKSLATTNLTSEWTQGIACQEMQFKKPRGELCEIQDLTASSATMPSATEHRRRAWN